MKWLKLKDLHCVVPNNTESYDRIILHIGNKKLALGKMTYDQKVDLTKYDKVRFEDQTHLQLWHHPVIGKAIILGEYLAREKENKDLEGELFFKNQGEFRFAYKIEFKNNKPLLKMMQLDCLKTASGFNQDKVYFTFNKKKFEPKLIVKQAKHYNLTKYPAVPFNDKLEINMHTSELLKADKLLGKHILKLKIESKAESEIIFERGNCLYHLTVQVLDLNISV
jgi:hypothetical protein